MEEKEGKEPNEEKAIQERESGMEEEWRMDMDVEEEIESRKKVGRVNNEIAEGVARYSKVLVCAERVSGKPQEYPATATARSGAKEARSHARTSESAEKIAKDTDHPGVTLADSVATLGVDLRTRVKKAGSKRKSEEEKVQCKVFNHKEEIKHFERIR